MHVAPNVFFSILCFDLNKIFYNVYKKLLISIVNLVRSKCMLLLIYSLVSYIRSNMHLDLTKLTIDINNFF